MHIIPTQRVWLQKASRHGIHVPGSGVAEPSFRIEFSPREEVEIPVVGLGQQRVIRGVAEVIGAGLGDPGGAEGVVGDALRQGRGAGGAGGFGDQGGDGTQRVGLQAAEGFADPIGCQEVTVAVGVLQEGQGLIDAGPVEVPLRIAIGGVEEGDDVFLVVEEAGGDAIDRLLDPAAQAVVPVGAFVSVCIY